MTLRAVASSGRVAGAARQHADVRLVPRHGDCVLPYPLLETVVRQSGGWQGGGVIEPLNLSTFEDLDLRERPELAREYPELGAGAGAVEYVRRPAVALAPTFGGPGRHQGRQAV
ncbi:hypothetical protein AB0D54_18520 [Streptomyces xanthophaeus]|uniref:hypothetical protein n=1 Tax=Streptomyces xanthophaeus TaxID=67385 RepID=UPI0034200494